MARHILATEYWICDRYPWGCDHHHKTKEEAEACEQRERNHSIKLTNSEGDTDECN